MTPEPALRAALAAVLLLAVAPAATAEERPSGPTGPEPGNAWVDNCPPGMMCAMVAAEAEEPPPPTPALAPGTCMDGADPGEDCRDDVAYFGSPPPGAEAPKGANESEPAVLESRTPGVGVALVAASVGVLAAMRRRA